MIETPSFSTAPLVIRGGRPLTGTWRAQPAKNAALPIIAASLLSAEPIRLRGVPRIADVLTMLEIISALGARCEWLGRHDLLIHTPSIVSTEPPYTLVAKMRASFNVLGPLLARAHGARVSMPGGCVIGARPVDQHIKALSSLGASIVEDGADYVGTLEQSLNGEFAFDIPTVTGTQNAICASVLGKGRVVLNNAALEPEVVDLVQFLNSLGARIEGAGTRHITIEGVEQLGGGEYEIIPDRIELGTMMLAAAATRGRVTFEGVRSAHVRALSEVLLEVGVSVTEPDRSTLRVDARQVQLNPVSVQAVEFPGFPTDLQPPLAAFLATVSGESILSDRIFPDRFAYSSELSRMGAAVELSDRVLRIHGSKLQGARVRAADIRAGGALIVAALAADGETRIGGMEFINRGYEQLESRLRALGVRVAREETSVSKVMPALASAHA